MGRSCPNPAMRRLWRLFDLPKTPSWCRSSDVPPAAAPTALFRKSMWWTCALRLTSPSSTSWRWQSSGPPPLLCLMSVPSYSLIGMYKLFIIYYIIYLLSFILSVKNMNSFVLLNLVFVVSSQQSS